MKTKAAKSTVPAEPTWEHRGHTITLTTAGAFHAKVNERHISAPSLDAIKKKINDATSVAFEPFTALELSMRADAFKKRPKDCIRTVAVTGVLKEGRGRYDHAGFVGEAKPKKEYGSDTLFALLHPDTPECRAAWAAYMDAQVESARIEEERKKIERALFCKIPRYEINTFLENGNRLVAEYPQQ